MKKPPNILVIDSYTAAHIGNAALAKSSLDIIKHIYPESPVRFIAYNPESIEKITNSPCCYELFPIFPIDTKTKVQKLLIFAKKAILHASWIIVDLCNYLLCHDKVNHNKYTIGEKRKKTLDDLHWCDIAVAIGGEVINDGFVHYLPFHLYTYWYLMRYNKKLIFFPQSIGPIKKPIIKNFVARIMNKSAIVCARDIQSLQWLNYLNVDKNKIKFIPDVAIRQNYIDKSAAASILKKLGMDKLRKPIMCLVLSNYIGVEVKGSSKDSNQINNMVKLIKCCMDKYGGDILLLPANLPIFGGTKKDYLFNKEIYDIIEKETGKRIYLNNKLLSPEQYKGIMQLCDIVISTRMHASILATMALVPTITIETQSKIRGYMLNIKMDQYCISISDYDNRKICNLIDDILQNKEALKNSLQEAKREIEQKPLMAGSLIKEIWEG